MVVLKECQLVVGDKDKSETASGLWDREAMGEWELIPIVVIEVEALFVLLEVLHEGGPVLYDVVMFMAINIHTILPLPISPSQPVHPMMSCALRNGGLVDAHKPELILHLRP